MSSLVAAFNYLTSLKRRKAQIDRKGSVAAIDIFLTPTNYSRNKQAPENMTQYTSEYLLPAKFLDGKAINPPKRGDRLLFNTGTKVEIIGEVEDLYSLGEDNLLGWRLKTE